MQRRTMFAAFNDPHLAEIVMNGEAEEYTLPESNELRLNLSNASRG